MLLTGKPRIHFYYRSCIERNNLHHVLLQTIEHLFNPSILISKSLYLIYRKTAFLLHGVTTEHIQLPTHLFLPVQIP